MRLDFVFVFACCIAAGSYCSAENREAARVPAFDPDTFADHVSYLASDKLEGRLPGSHGARLAAEYIIGHLKKDRVRPLQKNGNWYQEFPLPGKVTGRSILGVIPGVGALAGEAVIVTAHYDHIGIARPAKQIDGNRIFNGADDNASGVSALLLITNALAKMERTADANMRTIIVASFDAEEKGLQGAKYYARNPVWPLKQTAAVVNFDGVGRLRRGKVFASDAVTNPVLAATVETAAGRLGLVAETRFGGHGRSDHAVFTQQGIPGVHFVTGAHQDYHQVTDEAGLLNMEGGAQIAAIGFETIQRLITFPEKLTFHRLRPEFDVRFALNFANIVGIVPMVNAQEGRYPQILYVRPKSPAALIGIRSGDQVAALNGLRFERVEDLIGIFPQLDFAKGLRITMLRAGKEVDVTVPPDVIAQFSGPKSVRRKDGQFDVHFRYKPASASVSTVYLSGEFNNWNPVGRAMTGPNSDGEFTTILALPKGFHEYKFVEEGTEWKSDPLNMHQRGYYKNSVVWVGNSR